MTTFTRRAVQILSEEWEQWQEQRTEKIERGEQVDYFNSEAVYRRLADEGWPIPDYALDELWKELKQNEQIQGTGFLDADKWKMHGNWRFVWINPDILDETLYLEGDDYRIL